MPPVPPVRFGVDVLCARGAPRAWRRVGLVTNEAARRATDAQRPARVAILEAGVPLVRLFGPEHGLGASAADGAAVADAMDARTGLPVVSLYGARMRPDAAHLADLDAVLFDIPDVGARFYTYAWTLWQLLQACGDAGVPLVVLDRPNPLGGVMEAVEGPVLDPSCRSFIGEDDIPIRHGATLGELARLWQREHVPAAALEVIPCDGWDPMQAWPATGCTWVPTSPAMPSFDSARWYPGTCLFEATNLSVGRGTETPFALIGAPWLDAPAIVDALRGLADGVTDGVALRPVDFVPTSGPHAGRACHGVHLDLTAEATADGAAFVARTLRPVQLGLTLLGAIAARHPQAFAWARYPTAANPHGDDHLARLVGRRDVADRILTDDAKALVQMIRMWTQAPGWAERLRPVLCYPRGA